METIGVIGYELELIYLKLSYHNGHIYIYSKQEGFPPIVT